MRLRNFLGTLVLLLVTQAVVIGHSAEPSAPWPPDPDEIFEDGVQWEIVPEIEVDEGIRLYREEQIIEVFNAESETWLEFPYPSDWDYVSSATRLPDGQIQLIQDQIGFYPYDYQMAGDVYWLDAENGTYARPPTVCGTVKDKPGDGRWIAPYTFDGETPVLCHTSTGEEIDILPDSLSEWHVFNSPDQSAVVLAGRNIPNGEYDYQIFAYYFPTHELVELGEITSSSDTLVSECGWVSENKGMICKHDQFLSWPGTGYYAYDVTQPNSLTYAFHGWWDKDVFSLGKPPLYGVLDSQDYSGSQTGGRGSEHEPCRVVTYDSEGLHETEIAYACIPLAIDAYSYTPFIRRGNTIYILSKESENTSFSTLHLYNFEYNVGPLDLFSGEIEMLLGVSPDERYIVLLMDNNGKLEQTVQPTGTESVGHRVGIFDTRSGRFDYLSEPIGVYSSSQVAWLDSTTVVISSVNSTQPIFDAKDNEYFSNYNPGTLRRVRLEPSLEIYTTASLNFEHVSALLIDTSPDHCYWPDDKYDSFIHLATFEEVDVVREEAHQKYDIIRYWHDDSQLIVKVRPDGMSPLSVEYVVTLPGCSP